MTFTEADAREIIQREANRVRAIMANHLKHFDAQTLIVRAIAALKLDTVSERDARRYHLALSHLDAARDALDFTPEVLDQMPLSPLDDGNDPIS